MASYISPTSGPQGTSFLCHVEGLSAYVGKDLTIQLFRGDSGYFLDSAGPSAVPASGVVDWHPSIPYGSAYEAGTYIVGAVVWNPYPTKYVTTIAFASFTITPTMPPGRIKGKVTDSETGQPILPYVQIEVLKNGVVTYLALTNANGTYLIEEVMPGNYNVEASNPEYDAQTKPVAVQSNLDSAVDFQMVKKSVVTPSPPVLDALTMFGALSPVIFIGGTVAMSEIRRPPFRF